MMVLLRFLAPNNIRACWFAALGLVGFYVLELITYDGIAALLAVSGLLRGLLWLGLLHALIMVVHNWLLFRDMM